MDVILGKDSCDTNVQLPGGKCNWFVITWITQGQRLDKQNEDQSGPGKLWHEAEVARVQREGEFAGHPQSHL